MKFLVTLTPLEPYLFGGDTTFGKMLDKDKKKKSSDESSYIVHSRTFPQQSAILGMLRKEFMTQAGYLKRHRKGEWVDMSNKTDAEKLVGKEKFNILKKDIPHFGTIKEISPLFLLKNGKRYIKKVDIDSYEYVDGVLKVKGEDNIYFDPKNDIYDHYISIDYDNKLRGSDIFKEIEQVGNKKGGDENSFFKKISYILEDEFKFAFYLDCEYVLKDSIVTLGADRSSFKLEVMETSDNDILDYDDKNGYLVLLSDAYITDEIECEFAITSEISYRQIIGKKSAMTTRTEKEKNQKNNPFKKSDRVFLYEKGSVFIAKDYEKLIKALENPNLQKIGYNIHTLKETK